MGCRCNERRTALVSATRSAMRGDGAGARAAMQFVGRTMIEDARNNSVALRQAAEARLAILRRSAPRR